MKEGRITQSKEYIIVYYFDQELLLPRIRRCTYNDCFNWNCFSCCQALLYKYRSEIATFTLQVGSFSIQDEEDSRVNKELETFIEFATCFVIAIVVLLFYVAEKKIPLNIGFPLDYESSEIEYWIAFAYVLSSNLLTQLLICYLMLEFLMFIGKQLACGSKFSLVHYTWNNFLLFLTFL